MKIELLMLMFSFISLTLSLHCPSGSVFLFFFSNRICHPHHVSAHIGICSVLWTWVRIYYSQVLSLVICYIALIYSSSNTDITSRDLLCFISTGPCEDGPLTWISWGSATWPLVLCQGATNLKGGMCGDDLCEVSSKGIMRGKIWKKLSK